MFPDSFLNTPLNLTSSDWFHCFEEVEKRSSVDAIEQALKKRIEQKEIILPPSQDIFNAFRLCPFKDLKVVILGQDPYHHPGQAHGLSFSVPNGIKIPPSLRNIYKALNQDLGLSIPVTGNLTRWAEQGVLLLNSIMTVSAFKPASHRKIGWETFTDVLIQLISERKESAVFMLWGNYARSKAQLIDASRHLILEAPHPSPLSAHQGFFTCRHFSKCNTYLEQQGKEAIDWSIQSQSFLAFPENLDKP